MNRSVRILFIVALAGLSQSTKAGEAVGETIYRHCVTCHGPAGQGGKGGEYPSIAGLPRPYIEKQLQDFKSGKRTNKPMDSVLEKLLADDAAVARVAAYVAQLPELSPSPFEPSATVLEEFDSREEFDEMGQELFVNSCAECHGDDGRGREDKEAPPLVNQYPVYIRKQIGDFVAKRREHEHATKMFGELYQEEVEALLVHLGRMGSGE